MRHPLLLCCLMLLTAPAPAAPPTTAPAPRVLVLPFAPLDAREREEWIGRGVQQTLAADLARTELNPVTPDPSKPEAFPPTGGYDTATVRNLARAQSASYVIHGTYQFNDAEVRLTGTILDIEHDRPLGSLKVTASTRDVFDIQDNLARQARRLLVPAPAAEAAAETPLPQLARNVGPVSIAGYRPPSTYMTEATASATKLRNADLYDYYSPYGFGFYGASFYFSGSRGGYYTPLGNYNYAYYAPVWGSLRGGYPYHHEP